jgi:hypothetical protein
MFSNLYKTRDSGNFFTSAIALAIAFAITIAIPACHHAPPPAPVAQITHEPSTPQREASNEIPRDMYKNMPMYPGAQVLYVNKPRGQMREIMFKVDKPPPLENMIAFYKNGLDNNQFRITSTLTMRVRHTWSCDFQKDGRVGSLALYPDDHDKSAMDVNLIYEIPSTVDPAMLEPVEDFDVIGPGKVADKGSKETVKKN